LLYRTSENILKNEGIILEFFGCNSVKCHFYFIFICLTIEFTFFGLDIALFGVNILLFRLNIVMFGIDNKFLL